MTNRYTKIAASLIAVLVLALCTAALTKDKASTDPHAGHDHEAEAKDAHAGHDHEAEAKDAHAEEGHEAEDEHADEGHEHADEAASRPGLSAEQRKLYGIRLAQAGPGTLNNELRLTGEVALNADRVAHVVPRAGGIVREVHKSVGETVAAGELLAVLESVEVGEAKVDLLGKRRTLALAELDLERAQAVRASTVEVLKSLAADPAAADLAKINGREMGEDRGRILSAYAERAAARREHEREQTLVAKGVGTEAELVAAGNALHKAEAGYDALRDSLEFGSRRGLHDAERERESAVFALASAHRKLAFLGIPEAEIARLEGGDPDSLVAEQLNRIELRAPVAGTIIEKDIALGEKLGDDAAVYTLADLTTLWANLTVHARDLPTLREGTPAMISSRFQGEGTAGVVSLISPHIDEATRTATARVVLANPDGRWRPGMFVTAELALPAQPAAVVVPKAAVQNVEGESVVFVEHLGAFETKVVRLGRSDRENVEIVAGLEPGQPYVTTGAFELKARAVTSNLDPHAGHGH